MKEKNTSSHAVVSVYLSAGLSIHKKDLQLTIFTCFFGFINQIAVCADNKRKIEIVPEDYTNILVSLWKMISETKYYILCLGALIKPNLIFTTTQCSEKLNPLGEVGVLTGMNEESDRPEKILSHKQLLREESNFITLVVSTPTKH